jgi:hypothetical protein
MLFRYNREKEKIGRILPNERRPSVTINNFQRIGSISNAHAGREFEEIALNYFESINIMLHKTLTLPIGAGNVKKLHTFDLGCNSSEHGNIIVECKSHTWTSGGNVPSAKLTVWNEAMYYFFLASKDYRKIFFILKDYSLKRRQTLGDYYIRTYNHMIPYDVEVLEYDTITQKVRFLRPRLLFDMVYASNSNKREVFVIG